GQLGRGLGAFGLRRRLYRVGLGRLAPRGAACGLGSLSLWLPELTLGLRGVGLGDGALGLRGVGLVGVVTVVGVCVEIGVCIEVGVELVEIVAVIVEFEDVLPVERRGHDRLLVPRGAALGHPGAPAPPPALTAPALREVA